MSQTVAEDFLERLKDGNRSEAQSLLKLPVRWKVQLLRRALAGATSSSAGFYNKCFCFIIQTSEHLKLRNLFTVSSTEWFVWSLLCPVLVASVQYQWNANKCLCGVLYSLVLDHLSSVACLSITPNLELLCRENVNLRSEFFIFWCLNQYSCGGTEWRGKWGE